MHVCIICAASDVGRAMLQFGTGYPLGDKGLDWIKIHLVNLHGHKKKWALVPYIYKIVKLRVREAMKKRTLAL